MCAAQPRPITMPQARSAPPVQNPPDRPAPVPLTQQPLQNKTPSLTIGGSRKKDSSRRRRGAGAVSSAPVVNTGGSSGGVNV